MSSSHRKERDPASNAVSSSYYTAMVVARLHPSDENSDLYCLIAYVLILCGKERVVECNRTEGLQNTMLKKFYQSSSIFSFKNSANVWLLLPPNVVFETCKVEDTEDVQI